MTKRFTTKTGKKVEVSGQYRPSGSKSEVTLSRGNKAPPYKGEARTYTLVDRTNNRSNG